MISSQSVPLLAILASSLTLTCLSLIKSTLYPNLVIFISETSVEYVISNATKRYDSWCPSEGPDWVWGSIPSRHCFHALTASSCPRQICQPLSCVDLLKQGTPRQDSSKAFGQLVGRAFLDDSRCSTTSTGAKFNLADFLVGGCSSR